MVEVADEGRPSGIEIEVRLRAVCRFVALNRIDFSRQILLPSVQLNLGPAFPYEVLAGPQLCPGVVSSMVDNAMAPCCFPDHVFFPRIGRPVQRARDSQSAEIADCPRALSTHGECRRKRD